MSFRDNCRGGLFHLNTRADSLALENLSIMSLPPLRPPLPTQHHYRKEHLDLDDLAVCTSYVMNIKVIIPLIDNFNLLM